MNLKNIKTKLLVWYSIIIFTILFVFSSILLYVFYEQNLKTVDAQLLAVTNDIDHDIIKKYKNNFLKGFDEDEEFMVKNLYITIYKEINNKFQLLTSTNLDINIKNYKKLKKSKFQYFSTSNDIRVVRLHTNKLKENIYIQVATTLEDKINTSMNNLINTLFLLVPIILILAVFLGYFIIKNSLIPVKNVINEVKNIEINDLKNRIASNNSNDEIEELIITFNSMLDRLSDSFLKVKRFSNDVSHELKTPLTVIRGEIELGLRKERNINEYKYILKTILEETTSLQEIIDSLLFLSNTNKDDIIAVFETIELDELVINIVSTSKQLAHNKNIEFEFNNFDNTTCHGNPLLLKILIGNIISNAIKYSNKDSIIEVYLDNNIFKIKDYGIGIKEQDLPSIFDRFYRVDESRARGGHGLGLSIAKEIASLHGFRISINSIYNQYTEVSLNLK